MLTRRDFARFLPALPVVALPVAASAGVARGDVLFARDVPVGVMSAEALARAVRRGEELVAHYRGPYRQEMDVSGTFRVLSPASLEVGHNGELYLMAAQTAGPSVSGRMGAVKAFRYSRCAVLAGTGQRSRAVEVRSGESGYIARVVAERDRWRAA